MTDKALRITSKNRRGHWRCGVYHPYGPVHHPAGTFKPEDVERLKADALLTVEEVDPEPEEAEASGAEGGKPAKRTRT